MFSKEEAIRLVDGICSEPGFAAATTDFLVKLCAVDTTPNPDVAIMRRQELAAFEVVRQELIAVRGEAAFVPVNPAIASNPAFTLLHFTKTPERPEGLSPEATYQGRCNLLFRVKGENQGAGRNVAVNAHVDVVAPYYPPRTEGGVVHGRGACDDKAGVVAMTLATQVLERLKAKGLGLKKNLLLMYVIEEETGGNGSLSLAIDKQLAKEYDALVVLECVDNDIHPANRGAVWYKTTLNSPSAPLLPLAAACVLEMEQEGAAIKAESAHPLFPQRPVQTCHGIIGKFGEHPSRICGHVAFTVGEGVDAKKLEALVQKGVNNYIAKYGDKTKVLDPTTNKPKVERHYAIDQRRVEIFGATGHMGSILENDGAITKMAYVVQTLYDAGIEDLTLEGHADTGTLVLEGGQGFVPTHDIATVTRRMADAATRAMSQGATCATTYDKLHNNAFETDPDSPSMHNALTAMELAGGRKKDAPVRGWTVSCDARIFADERPGLPIVTAGAGRLSDAHSDHEAVVIADLVKCVKFLVLHLLLETGSVR